MKENITEVSKELEKDVVVKIFYTDEDVTGLDMNTLRIGHYIDGVGWKYLKIVRIITAPVLALSLVLLHHSQSLLLWGSNNRPAGMG